MEDNIYVNFIGFNPETFFNLYTDKITITFINLNNIVLYDNEFEILYDIDNTTNNKKYFIKI